MGWDRTIVTWARSSVSWTALADSLGTAAASHPDVFVIYREDLTEGEEPDEALRILYADEAGVPGIAPHDLRRTCAKLCRAGGGELEQIQMLLGHASVQTTERYLGTKQDLVHAPNDAIKLRVAI